jgi:arylsulfatase A
MKAYNQRSFFSIFWLGQSIQDTLKMKENTRMPQTNEVFLWIGVFLFLVGTVISAEKPNIILIYTDDQGWGDASCYNPDSKFETPNIDRLAGGGLYFSDAHSSASVCTPSRYGLLTGRYCWRTPLKSGVVGSDHRAPGPGGPCLIEDGRWTLATLLRDQGFHTAMIGKWHLGLDVPGEKGNRDWSSPLKDMPLDKGFDYFFGIPSSMNYGLLAWFQGRYAAVPPTQYTMKKRNPRALDDYRIYPPYQERGEGLTNETKKDQSQFPKPNPKGKLGLEVAPDFADNLCMTRFTDQAIQWMGEHLRTHQKSDPFFLYLAYTAPHKPVAPHPGFEGKGKAGAYGELMIETDFHVGRLLDFLDEMGIDEDTMVILTSDNGPENTWKPRLTKFGHSSSGTFRGGKRDVYEGGHRVPFIIRWPKVIPPGTRYDSPVSQLDFMATFAEMVGEELPANQGEDSVSFFRVLGDPGIELVRGPLVHHSSKGQFAVRNGDWKLVLAHNNSEKALFNLREDPSESINHIDSMPGLEDLLINQLAEVIRSGRSTPGPAQPYFDPGGDWLPKSILLAKADQGAEKTDRFPVGQWVSIFNGMDLTGWTPKIKGFPLGENPGMIFRVSYGLLKVSYDSFSEFGNRFGHIFFEEPFSNYRLRLKYRFTGHQIIGGPKWAIRNSGVMLHCPHPKTMTVEDNFPTSVEVQLLGGDGAKPRTMANVCTPGTDVFIGGELAEKHCNKSSSQTYHGDQWVELEVIVRGNKKITHIVNGEKVMEYTNPQLDDGTPLSGGYFSLQAESHPCEFKDIEIMRLPSFEHEDQKR